MSPAVVHAFGFTCVALLYALSVIQQISLLQHLSIFGNLKRANLKILVFISRIFLFLFLTALTQIGGLVYFISFSGHNYISKKFNAGFTRNILKFLSFILLYLIFTFVIIPPVAKLFGRVQLPVTKTSNVQPLNFLTCLFNRNYVRPELRETLYNVAGEMNKAYPGTVVNYLDANFPFINNFLLIPHLSHSDGKKLDIAFFYRKKLTGEETEETPSFIGYGICEEPMKGEQNTADICGSKGYWQYSLLKKIMPQTNKQYFSFDADRTKTFINLVAQQKDIEKIFIEPYLKTRMKLTNKKIRFHSCNAVRHDDHVHIQIN